MMAASYTIPQDVFRKIVSAIGARSNSDSSVSSRWFWSLVGVPTQIPANLLLLLPHLIGRTWKH